MRAPRGSCRAQEPAWGDRAGPWPLSSPLIALGHTGREEGWAWMEGGTGCCSGACNDEQAMFLQRCGIWYSGRVQNGCESRFSIQEYLPALPCSQHTSHLLWSMMVVPSLQETLPFSQLPAEQQESAGRKLQHGTALQGAQHSDRTSNPQLPCPAMSLGKATFGDSSSPLPHSYKAAWTQGHHGEECTTAFLPSVSGFNSGLIKPHSQGWKGLSQVLLLSVALLNSPLQL